MRSSILILVALGALAIALSQTRVASRVEETLGLAWLYNTRGVVQPPDGAAIVALDGDSTSWLQRNSRRLAIVAPGLHACLGEEAAKRLGTMRSVNELPREAFACLIEALAAEGPRLQVLDVHFTVAQSQDGALAATIRRAGNVLLLEQISEQEPPGTPGPLLLRHRPVRVLEKAALATVGFLVESAPGHVTTRYLTRFDAYPDLRVMPVEVHRRVSGTSPRLAEREFFWLYGPPRTVPTWSVRAVFEPQAQHPLDIHDRVVFIGGSSLDPEESRDSFAVPAFSPAMSGVELAATAYLNLHAAQRLRAPAALGRAVLACTVAVTLTGAALFLPRRLAIGSVFLLAVAISGAAVALFHQGVWLPIAVPLVLGFPLAGLVGLERRLQFARGLTISLLPRPLSKRMLETGSADPRTQVASAMFLDLVGSTGLAEKHGPDVYTRIMARYYSLVTDAVDRNGGSVYKYEGDGILALFFGSAALEEDTRSALDAALRITSTVSAQMAENGLPDVGIRIGISTGAIAVGMLRFGEHASVSTMGDAVHRAYRLQEMGRELMQEAGQTGVVTLVDDATASLAKEDEQHMRFRTTVTLRGRSSPTSVYHLLA